MFSLGINESDPYQLPEVWAGTGSDELIPVRGPVGPA